MIHILFCQNFRNLHTNLCTVYSNYCCVARFQGIIVTFLVASSYSRSPSYSADLRRRGSVASLSSRGSYSRYSADRWTLRNVSAANDSSSVVCKDKYIFTLLVITFSHRFVCFPDYETERERLAPERQMWSMHIRLVGRDEDANPTLLWRKGGETHQAIWKHAESQGTAFPAWLFIQYTIYIFMPKGSKNVLLVPPPQLDKSPTWILPLVLLSRVPWNGI